MINENHPTLIEHARTKTEAQRLIPQCPTCGKLPVLSYEPGCLWASCDCKTWTSHEEDRMELAREIREELNTKKRP